MRQEQVAAGLGRADEAIRVADDPVGIRRGTGRLFPAGRLPRGGMLFFGWGTPSNRCARVILSGADDDGQDQAHVAIGLVMANELGPV